MFIRAHGEHSTVGTLAVSLLRLSSDICKALAVSNEDAHSNAFHSTSLSLHLGYTLSLNVIITTALVLNVGGN